MVRIGFGDVEMEPEIIEALSPGLAIADQDPKRAVSCVGKSEPDPGMKSRKQGRYSVWIIRYLVLLSYAAILIPIHPLPSRYVLSQLP